MAYIFRNMSVLAYANGFTLWHYTTPDLATAVDSSGYFNAASDMVRVGDMILVNTDTAASCATCIFVVSRQSPGAVSISKIGG